MPYMIAEQDGQFCVYKHNESGEPTGDTLGCHATRADAESQMAALYASEPDAAKSIKALLAEQRTTAIKSLGDERFGGYLAIWGHPGQKDLTGEWFTPHTEGMTELFDQLGQLPTLFHHGNDKQVKATLVGMLDTMQPDDVGLWVEGILNKRNKYVEGVKKLLGLDAL